jgi:hypothetical protein
MNKTWLAPPIILKGQNVDLIPLEKEHFKDLYTATSDKQLWELIPTDCSDKEIFTKTHNAFGREKQLKKSVLPLKAYFEKTKYKIMGTTWNAAYFSILDDERETAKHKILTQIEEKTTNP